MNLRCRRAQQWAQRLRRPQWVLLGLAIGPMVRLEAQAPEASPILESGWAVTCRLEGCESHRARLEEMAEVATESAEVLANLGFSRAHLASRTLPELQAAGGVVVARPRGGSGRYFQIEVSDLTASDELTVLGGYTSARGSISVGLGSGAGSIIHEMLHAVQEAEIPRSTGGFGDTSLNWVLEGSAAAVETLAPRLPRGARTGTDYRYAGISRDWSRTLASEEGNDEYQTSELWLSVDASLRFLPALYANLAASRDAGGISAANEYEVADRALSVATGAGLEAAYRNLVSLKNAPAYPHCRRDTLACAGGQCSFSLRPHFRDEPMNASCTQPTLDTSTLACPQPTLEVELLGNADQHAFLLARTWPPAGPASWHVPGETIVVERQFRLWALNVDVGAPSAGYGATSLDARVTATCPPSYTLVVHSQSVSGAAIDAQGGAGQANVDAYYYLFATGEGERHTSVGGADVATTPVTTPVRFGGQLSLSRQASLGGSSGRASLETRLNESDGVFTLTGNIAVDTSGQYGMASAELIFGIAISAAATVTLENCALFQPRGLSALSAVSRSGGTCVYRASGSPDDTPDLDGIPLPPEARDAQVVIFEIDHNVGGPTGRHEPVSGPFSIRIAPLDD